MFLETVWEQRESDPGLPCTDKSKYQKGPYLAAAGMLLLLAGLTCVVSLIQNVESSWCNEIFDYCSAFTASARKSMTCDSQSFIRILSVLLMF